MESTASSSSNGGSIFRAAATFCLWSPLLLLAVNLISPSVGQFVTLAGILAGVVALCGLSKYGKKGILAQAVVGLVIHTLLIVSAIYILAQVKDAAQRLSEKTQAAEKE